MGFMDKAKQMFSSAKEQAGPMIEKTKDFASDAAEKAAPYVEKAKTAAVEGAEAIKEKVDEIRTKDEASGDPASSADGMGDEGDDPADGGGSDEVAG
jgi:hypothetical protein